MVHKSKRYLCSCDTGGHYRYRAHFVAQRELHKIDYGSDDISASLYIDPDPMGLGEFLPQFSAMSLACVEVRKGLCNYSQLF